MVEILLVYFSSAKAGYVSEIPVMSDIPVHDVIWLVYVCVIRQEGCE